MKLLVIVVLLALMFCPIGAVAHEPVCTISVKKINSGTFVCEENVIVIRASDIFPQSVKPMANTTVPLINSTAIDPFNEEVMASVQRHMLEDMERKMLEDALRAYRLKQHEKHLRDGPQFVRGSSGWGIEINWGN